MRCKQLFYCLLLFEFKTFFCRSNTSEMVLLNGGKIFFDEFLWLPETFLLASLFFSTYDLCEILCAFLLLNYYYYTFFCTHKQSVYFLFLFFNQLSYFVLKVQRLRTMDFVGINVFRLAAVSLFAITMSIQFENITYLLIKKKLTN